MPFRRVKVARNVTFNQFFLGFILLRPKNRAGCALRACSTCYKGTSKQARFLNNPIGESQKKLVTGYISGYNLFHCNKSITAWKKKFKNSKKNWLQTGYNFKNWLQFTTVLVPVLRRFSVRIKNWLQNHRPIKTGYIFFSNKKHAPSCFSLHKKSDFVTGNQDELWNFELL